MQSNKTTTAQQQAQEMLDQAKSQLKIARQNFKVARKHIDAYNQYVLTGFTNDDADNPRACERWNLDNLLEGLPDMEKKLLATCRRYFPDSVRLVPVRMNIGEGLSDHECKLAHICVAQVQMSGMYESVWQYYETIRKLRALRAVPFEMETDAAKLARCAEFYSRKTYQQERFYAKD